MTWPFRDLAPYSFGALAIDPPWAFETYSGEKMTPHRAEIDHYKTMEFEDIAALPIGRLAARDCAIFLWTISSHLDQAIALIGHWGLSFKTVAFVWDKGRMSHGYWTRKRTEICLLATRGTPKRRDKGVPELIEEPRREHSRKPEEFYARVERLVDGPYAEIFATTPRPGWAGWGDQYGKYQLKKDAAE